MLGLELVRKIADGSVVEAYLARSGAGKVLVQVSRPELAGDPELYGRFLDQTRNSKLSQTHPGLIGATSAQCSDDGRFVLTSQPLSGRTAVDHLREWGPLSVEEGRRWGLELADALEYLHTHGLVHGHLSPANIFLDGDPSRPQVRLLDTGLLLFRSIRSLKPAKGLVLVPPEYLCPERVVGQRGTVRSDVYGLGVLLFELLTGAPPFRGQTSDETRDLHLISAVPALEPRLVPLESVLRRCLRKEPEDRFGTMDDFRAALLEAPMPVPVRREVRVAAVAAGLAAVNTEPEPMVLAAPITSLRPSQTPPPPPKDEIQQWQPAPVAEERQEQWQPHQPLGTGGMLGSYRLEAMLGEGGMGQVFVATHRTLGRQVAIKLLRPELARDPVQVTRFVQEAQAVNRVQHPHIVQVHDLVHETQAEGGRVYFVMEFLEGDSIKAMGKERPLELPRSIRLIRQAAEALAAAHSVGVVHRDVKPDNLFVTKDPSGTEVVKVLDFGVARVRDAHRLNPRQTQTGQVVGTPLWMAPEQVLGRDVDARADIYALATVLYVMLTRRFPFDGLSMSEVVMQRLERNARTIEPYTFLGEPVPPSLRTLLAVCLSRDLSKRPASMSVVATRLRQVEQELMNPQVEAFDVDEEAPKRPAPWWNTWVALGLGVGTAAMLAVRFLL